MIEHIQNLMGKLLLKAPPLVVKRLNGKADNTRGNVLHPNLQLLGNAAKAAPGIEEIPLKKARAAMENSAVAYDKKPPKMRKIENRSIVPQALASQPLAIRIYQATGWTPGGVSVLYFHGGGHVVGSLDSHDPTCCRIADALDAQVISVDYRLAPEDKFPAAVEDVAAAYDYVLQQQDELGINLERLVVSGDSAGGNLAAVCCLHAKMNDKPQPGSQLLIYPMTDLRMGYQSYDDFAEGYILTKATMQWFVDCYTTEEDRLNPLASPLLAESLQGLAPAVVLLAGFDPLYDEGLAYAERLVEADVPVSLIEHSDMVHGYIALAGTFTAGQKAFPEMAEAVKKQLAIA